MKTKFNFILIALCLIVFCFTGNVNAAESIPLDTFNHDSSAPYSPTDYLLFETESGTKSAVVFYYDSTKISISDCARIIKDSNPIKLDMRYTTGTGYRFILWNYDSANNKWTSSTNRILSSSNTNLTTSVDGQLVASTFDVYFTDGTIFFQPTPVGGAPLEEVKLEELEEKITGTMGTITIVAVSCLALLILLPLFWKALFRFL